MIKIHCYLLVGILLIVSSVQPSLAECQPGALCYRIEAPNGDTSGVLAFSGQPFVVQVRVTNLTGVTVGLDAAAAYLQFTTETGDSTDQFAVDVSILGPWIDFLRTYRDGYQNGYPPVGADNPTVLLGLVALEYPAVTGPALSLADGESAIFATITLTAPTIPEGEERTYVLSQEDHPYRPPGGATETAEPVPAVFENSLAIRIKSGGYLLVDDSATGTADGLTWANAIPNLQTALVLAGDPLNEIGEIWVAEGTYTPAGPGGDRNVSFQLIDGVTLYGGFPSGALGLNDRDPQTYPTILSGDLDDDDATVGNSENSYHVVYAPDEANNDVLDGFTITAGNANGALDSYKQGGGMRINSSLTIRNCTFHDNYAVSNGGAVFNLINNAPHFQRCVFYNNISGGSGGAISSVNSTFRITNCLLYNNQAGANGGGIIQFAGLMVIANSTIVGNTAAGTGGGVYSDSNNATVQNSILWDNADSSGVTGSSQINDYSQTLQALYSCIQGGWSGAGNNNIGDDPKFTNAALHDYTLKCGSPAIDAGSNALAVGIDVDLAGNPRVVNGSIGFGTVVDMGAYEVQQYCGGSNGEPEPPRKQDAGIIQR